LISLASGAPLRASYAHPVAKEGAWLFATHRAQLPQAKLSRFDRNAALVQYLGIDPAQLGDAILPISSRADANLELERVSRAELIAIHPGTSAATPYKRYSAEGYGKLARELKAKRHSRCIVTYGPGPDERAFADAVVAASGGAAELAPPTECIADLAALFARCRLYVGSDSGPLHIASLVGTPVVQILGPTDPIENAPFSGTPSRSLRVSLACSPCRRGCEAATCMRLVQPERVFAAAVELLSEGDTTSRPRPTSALLKGDLAGPSPP
jgi:3-deoxy-D-manno-octulosonic-acid transferase/heptosyltransferase-1